MAFTLPVFNLSCRIRRFVAGPYPPGGPAGGTVVPCQQRASPQPILIVTGAAGQASSQIALMLPPLTDIRMQTTTGSSDLVELPNGSGLWYGVLTVQDVAKGFANEHRMAVLISLNLTSNMWVTPQP